MKHASALFANSRLVMVAGIILGIIVAMSRIWDWLEPVTGLATMAFAASAWWQTRRAEDAHYEINDNHDESWVVALEVGRPVSEAANAQFGHVDVLIRAQDVIGTSTLLTDEHYEKVARAVYSACARCQNRSITLVMSGPIGLAVVIGQMIGVEKFRLGVWQFQNGQYLPLPRPRREWLEHR
jgi:hypothetical protein